MSGTILILDDAATNRIVLKVRLVKACYQVMSAGSLAEGLELARLTRPDVVVYGCGLDGLSSAALQRRLASDPATAGLPCIALTGGGARARAEAMAAGAADALCRPLNETHLLARLRQLLRERAPAPTVALLHGLAEAQAPFDEMPTRVVLIWGERAQGVAWRHALTGRLGTNVRLVTPEEALLEAGGHKSADLYVIAADLSRRGDGLRLMSELRARPGSRNAAMCIALGGHGAEAVADALDLGADEVLEADLSAPGQLAETEARIVACLRRKRDGDVRRDRLAAQLRDAVTDPLTGLSNRRAAMAKLAQTAGESGANGHPYALLVMDLDHFKSVNDTYGHPAGDGVLAGAAARLAALMPDGSHLARMGGEEFLAILPAATRADAVALARRLCDGLAAQPVALGRDASPGMPQAIAATMSVGVALSEPHEPPNMVLHRADRGLLASKAAGRNRVTLAVLRPTPASEVMPAA